MYIDAATAFADSRALPERVVHPGARASIILPFVMCGGSGTRLWPLSRTCMPKQFVSLDAGASSTFQSTLRRVSHDPAFGRATVIAASGSQHIVEEQVVSGGVGADIVFEPEGRDSCAAIAVAAIRAASVAPDSVVLVMSADHVVSDHVAFRVACAKAAALARDGHLMVFGSGPSRPATEFGYIVPGEALGADGAARVARFVEKPDVESAANLSAEGALWNAGYFLFRADVMLAEMKRLVPDVLSAARAAMSAAQIKGGNIWLDPPAFAQAPKLSFDRAVMERTDRAGVLPVCFDWLDIGTWGALWAASNKNGDGNALHGRATVLGTRDSLVRSESGLLTAVLGLDNVVVVTTQDAVLVASKERAGDVKDLVGLLRAGAQREIDEHLRMHRPWGWYQRIDIGDRFQVKRIIVKPQGRLSLQKHYHRAEHWVVVKGTAEVRVNGEVRLVHENQSIELPIGCVHRLANPGKIILELIEVQVGSYTGEDDIVRFDDDYGR